MERGQKVWENYELNKDICGVCIILKMDVGYLCGYRHYEWNIWYSILYWMFTWIW